jgi:hypothetical protein
MWDKSARGGEGARVRNSVPQALEMPLMDWSPKDQMLYVDVSQWDGTNGFVKPYARRQEQVNVKDGYSFGCVQIRSHPEGLDVQYHYNQHGCGAPDRPYLHRNIVVKAEQQLQILCNGRFSDICSGIWWYKQVTVHIAWIDREPSKRVFLENAPDLEIRALADLW